MTPEQHKQKYLNGTDFLLKGEFADGDAKRETVLTNSEKYAGWTIPNIFPNDPLTSEDEMQGDYQSVGAQAVTFLANKIMMALFQPSRPFFRVVLTDKQMQGVTATTGMNKAQIEESLAEMERKALREMEKLNGRVVLTDIITQLVVTGNSLLYIPPDEKMQNYSVRDYTILRDLRGGLVKLIIRETKSVSSLSDELAALAAKESYEADADISIYTGILKVGKDQYVVWQELEDICSCHKSIGRYTEDALPWVPLTWNLSRNKDYGSSLVELYAGDFHSLSTIAEAILDYTTIVTDLKVLVDPAGMTDVRKLNEAASGDYVHGREEDIFVHTANVSDASTFLDNQFTKIERRISAAFLMNTGVTRQAERVTAEEIRMQAQELESSLGGVYSRLAQELQTPLAKRLLAQLDPLFKDVEPVVVTGLESLSRNSELDRTRAFVADLAAFADVPEEVRLRLNFDGVISVLGAGHGIDYKSILKSDEQVKKDQTQEAQQNATAAGMEAGAVDRATGQQ
jgi:hypothetical protein